MITKSRFIEFCLVIAFFLCENNVEAKDKIPPIDSTCCEPINPHFISASYPVFCVTWKSNSDSTCLAPQGFEIEWKLYGTTLWTDDTVNHPHGNTISFCDSTDTCGLYVWRVRTICNDSTFSSWVDGDKFTMPCPGGRLMTTQNLSISPNPASNKITISGNNIKPGPVKISIVNIAGKSVFEKQIDLQPKNQLREELFINGWQKGIYFVSILANGVVLDRGSFIKE
jgi:hypothetical protein